MGRATVLSGGAEGLYTVRLDFGKAQRDARVAKLDARLVTLAAQIAEMEAGLAEVEAQVAEAQQAATDAVDAYALAMQADPQNEANKALADHVNALIAALYERAKRLDILRGPLDLLKAEQAQLQADRVALLAVKVEVVQQAWCADYTENASGEVATVEVPGEPQAVVLAPGGRDPVAADGVLRARGLMSPAQAYYNAAMLPGWQRWMPTFRAGTLLGKDDTAQTATVVLDEAQSSAAGLDVMQGALVLTDVPVQYMTCHARAFEVGDRVLVALEGGDWAQPKVVGFLEHPRACVFWPDRVVMDIRNLVKEEVTFTVFSGAGTTYTPTADGFEANWVRYDCPNIGTWTSAFTYASALTARVGMAGFSDFDCVEYPNNETYEFFRTPSFDEVNELRTNWNSMQEFDHTFDGRGYWLHMSSAAAGYVDVMEMDARVWRELCAGWYERRTTAQGETRRFRLTPAAFIAQVGAPTALTIRNEVTSETRSYAYTGWEAVSGQPGWLRLVFEPEVV